MNRKQVTSLVMAVTSVLFAGAIAFHNERFSGILIYSILTLVVLLSYVTLRTMLPRARVAIVGMKAPRVWRAIKVVSVIGAIPIIAYLAVLFLPPWWGKPTWMLHRYTTIPYVFGWPPRHFTGVWLKYRTDGHEELSYKDGKRDGVQRHYNLDGSLERTYEFKKGMPWSGRCDFWDDKPWLQEYKDGKVWTGVTSEQHGSATVHIYHFQGEVYDEAKYRGLNHFGAGGWLIGKMWVPPSHADSGK